MTLLMQRRKGGSTLLLKSNAGNNFAGWTTARAGTALYFDVSRVVQSAGSGVSRVAHYLDCTDGQFQHWLLELSKTNSALNNRDLGQASWARAACTIGGSTTGADGSTITTNGIIANNGVVVAGIINAAAYAWTLSTPQAFYIVGKPGNKSLIWIQTTDKNLVTATSWVNLSTGAIGTTAGTHTFKTWQLANGCYLIQGRLSTSSTPATGGQTIAYGPADADSSVNVTGDGATVNCYLDYVGMENNQGWPSSIIVTGASAVSRVADSQPTRAHNSTPQPRTLYADYTEIGSIQFINGGMTMLTIGAAGGADSMYVTGWTASSVAALANMTGTSSNALALSSTVGFGDRGEIAANCSAAFVCTVRQSKNTAAETTTSGGAAAAYGATYISANYTIPHDGLGILALRAVKDALGGALAIPTMRAF